MVVEMLVETALMTLTTEAGVTIKQNLPCQLDTVNIPWNMEIGLIPTDWYDLFSIGWKTPVPARGQYFVDQATSARYQVFGNPATYNDHLEVRVTRYPGGA